MIIDRDVSPFVVACEDNVASALRKIGDNKLRFVFCVEDNGQLRGVLTDGDFRRWVLDQTSIDLSVPAASICNRSFVSASIDAEPERIAGLLSGKFTAIPLVDGKGHLCAVARLGSSDLRIGGRAIGQENPTFVIAEIGNNHNGSLELAYRLIDAAADAGADCAKFQMRSMTALYRNAGDPNDPREDLGAQYTLDLLARTQLSTDDLLRCFDRCRERQLIPLCTPWDEESARVLDDYGIDGFKVASADLTNHDLLRCLAATRRPLLMSTGMSQESEIRESIALLRRLGAPFALLHCNSTYPAPFKDVNLRYLERLKKIGACPVGYSGHERGWAVPVAAVALGATVVEKHFTFDRNMEGNDHKVSLLPDEFRQMVEAIRNVEEALGSDAERQVTQGERMNRENLAKSLVAAEPIAAGTVITAAMLAVKSPGRGLQPNRRTELLGRPARRDFACGDFFYSSDLADTVIGPRAYSFRRPWGVPVRYHDVATLLTRARPDLVEFHLSFKDLEVDVRTFFDQPLDVDFVVHAPELFAGDHTLDLASLDRTYRSRSVAEMQRVVDVTRSLAPFFPKTKRPLIITNMGGFTQDGPLPTSERAELYDLIADSLGRIDAEGVEIIAQTMPPYPWHFGGQRYHNLFMEAEEIVDFCRQHGSRICLDVSHSKLTCNTLHTPFSSFIRTVAPYTAHLHLVDARGIDDEGLQVGDGEIDFAALAEILDAAAPNAGFIPEIWQGHKNDGEGFWVALERLEPYFG